MAYSANIGSFEFVQSPETDVRLTLTNAVGTELLVESFNVFQNPLSGQYESLNEEYCDISHIRP
jgi:hypothetical protein